MSDLKVQAVKHLHDEMDKVKPACLNQKYMVFEKHDGWFGYLDFPSCVIHSRGYREVPSLTNLSNLIRSKRPNCSGRLIFEIMLEGYEIDRFHELNGILNRADEQAEGAYLRVHDFLPDFKTYVPAGVRYSYATEIVKLLDLPEVKVSPVLATSANPSDWKDIAQAMWSDGREGVVLKKIDGHYEPGRRVHSMMKIKESVTANARVTELIQGKEGSKYEGMLGALVAVDANGVVHKVSGMTDSEREEWWESPSKIVGKIIEIKAMKRLRNGSLREPRFKAVRWNLTHLVK